MEKKPLLYLDGQGRPQNSNPVPDGVRKAYVQKELGDWLNDNCFASSRGFSRMGYNVIGFEHDQIETLGITKKDIVHGGIPTVRKVLDILGVQQPEVVNIHNKPEFKFFIHRKMEETTLGQIRTKYNEYPFFIKPLDQHKLFTGFPVRNNILDLMRVRHLPDDTKILYSQHMEILSEYRCFVLDGEIVGCKNYAGDYRLLPHFNMIELAIKAYKDQPRAFSIDFAIAKIKGYHIPMTELIEINDGFSLGSYGLNNITYCKMIQARWEQIMTYGNLEVSTSL